MPLDTAGLIAASRQFASALLAPNDDRDTTRIVMGLLAVVHLITKEDPTSRAMVALQLRQMASEMENSAPPLLNWRPAPGLRLGRVLINARRPVSGVERTCPKAAGTSPFDPELTSTAKEVVKLMRCI